MIGLFKKVLVFSLMFIFLIYSYFAKLLIRDSFKRLVFYTKNTSFFSKVFLKICNIKVNIKNNINIDNKKGCLIVSNHLSYIDAICLSALTPSVMLSTKEVQTTPILGWFAYFGGSIFIERRDKNTLLDDLDKIKDILGKNFKIIFFPEGTTSDGNSVLPFKSPLFKTAVSSKVDVIGLCIKYKMINSEPFNSKNKDLICYYGDMQFWPHFVKFLKAKKILVEIKQACFIASDKNLNRKEIHTCTYNSILSEYNLN
jgi:1-acyl-sn-glycerol-3-phosphate acyltransferase